MKSIYTRTKNNEQVNLTRKRIATSVGHSHAETFFTCGPTFCSNFLIGIMSSFKDLEL